NVVRVEREAAILDVKLETVRDEVTDVGRYADAIRVQPRRDRAAKVERQDVDAVLLIDVVVRRAKLRLSAALDRVGEVVRNLRRERNKWCGASVRLDVCRINAVGFERFRRNGRVIVGRANGILVSNEIRGGNMRIDGTNVIAETVARKD